MCARLFGTVQDGSIDNTTYPEIAAGIIAAKTAKREGPGFQLEGGKVVATLVDVSVYPLVCSATL